MLLSIIFHGPKVWLSFNLDAPLATPSLRYSHQKCGVFDSSLLHVGGDYVGEERGFISGAPRGFAQR